jgi:hypothetical protein
MIIDENLAKLRLLTRPKRQLNAQKKSGEIGIQARKSGIR